MTLVTLFGRLYLVVCLALIITWFFVGLGYRRNNIVSYNEHKQNPQYFTNEDFKEDNKVISRIKAFQGTIFSFYNGVNFEYFDIEDGEKIIVTNVD